MENINEPKNTENTVNEVENTEITDTTEVLKPKGKSKFLLGATIGALVLLCGVYNANGDSNLVNTVSATSRTNSNTNTSEISQYREIEVERGDIVVGVTEAGTATLNTTTVSFDFDCTVDEVMVKSGQFINQGDVVATLNLDDIKEAYESDYKSKSSSLSSAQISLQSTLLSAESSKLSAINNLNTAIANGENAETLHNYTINSINTDYEELLDDLTELYFDLDEALEELDSEAVYSYEIVDMREEMYQMILDLSDLSKQMSHAASCTGTHSATCSYPHWSHDYDSLKSEYDALSYQKARLAIDLDIAFSDYDDDVEKLYDNVDNISTSITKKENEIISYNLSKDIKILDAISDNQERLLTYENAEIEYNNTIAKIDNDIAKAQLEVSDLIDELNDITLALDDGTITAPATGFVMSIVSQGDELRSDNALISVADRDIVNVLVSISQDDIASIQVGSDVQVTFDAYDDIVIPSIVDNINITSSGMTVNYTVTIECDITDIPDIVIYQGMTSDVTFIQRQALGVLKVSNKCVTANDGKQYVKILSNGQIIEKEIETGFSDGFEVEVISGLNEGDIVILESVVSN